MRVDATELCEVAYVKLHDQSASHMTLCALQSCELVYHSTHYDGVNCLGCQEHFEMQTL